SGDLPSQYQKDSHAEEYTVDTGGACHNAVPVQEAAKESCQANEDTQDEQDTDRHFTEGHNLGKPGIGLCIEHALEKFTVPRISNGGTTLCGDLNGAGPEAF